MPIVFQTIDASDARFARLIEQVDRRCVPATTDTPGRKDGGAPRAVSDQIDQWAEYQLQALWLAQCDLPSHLGLLTAKNGGTHPRHGAFL